MLMAFHLEKRWKKLFSSALYRLKTLHSTKVKFSQMTANDIEKFKQEVRSFWGFINWKLRNNISFSELERKSMMKVLCHQHYAFISLTHRPLNSTASSYSENIVKVLLNILSIKPLRSFKLSIHWEMLGEGNA